MRRTQFTGKRPRHHRCAACHNPLTADRDLCEGCTEDVLAERIKGLGWRVQFVDYCRSRLPSVADFTQRTVAVSLVDTSEPGQRTLALSHGLRHMLDPRWHCGRRDTIRPE